jgi:hypothetical protein
MVQPISDKPLLPGRLGSQLELRVIEAHDPELGMMPVRPEVISARLRQNAVCLGGFRKGTMIGYMWFCYGSYDEDEVRCTYVLEQAQTSVFDFDFYLFPEYRMGLGFAGIWNGANAFLNSRGIRQTFSRLTRFNTASRRAHRHLGWKLVARAIFLQLGRVELMAATLHPYLHASIRSTSRVRLTLRPDVLGKSSQ